MACALHSALETDVAAPSAERVPFARAVSMPMSRCECAEVSFEEIARQVDAGTSLDDATRRTGCGTTCTACLPDLRRFLASR